MNGSAKGACFPIICMQLLSAAALSLGGQAAELFSDNTWISSPLLWSVSKAEREREGERERERERDRGIEGERERETEGERDRGRESGGVRTEPRCQPSVGTRRRDEAEFSRVRPEKVWLGRVKEQWVNKPHDFSSNKEIELSMSDE